MKSNFKDAIRNRRFLSFLNLINFKIRPNVKVMWNRFLIKILLKIELDFGSS